MLCPPGADPTCNPNPFHPLWDTVEPRCRRYTLSIMRPRDHTHTLPGGSCRGKRKVTCNMTATPPASGPRYGVNRMHARRGAHYVPSPSFSPSSGPNWKHMEGAVVGRAPFMTGELPCTSPIPAPATTGRTAPCVFLTVAVREHSHGTPIWPIPMSLVYGNDFSTHTGTSPPAERP